jgi:hypothetical protein
MRKPRVARVLAAVAAGALSLVPAAARAGDNDLVLSRLGTVITDGGGDPIDVIGSNIDFRALASELGVVLAPRLLTPSDTLGFGGFQFSADIAYTSISHDQPYWRVLESSPDPGGGAVSHGPELMPTVGFFARKGIWLPLPSFEVGVGAVHMLESRIWAGQGYLKLALHEGYHELPIPSVALRVGASRVMGTDQIDLTVGSFDASVSKDFGLAGTMTVSPYGGWNLLWIVPRSEVIDRTPQVDIRVMPTDARMNFSFDEQDDILRHRFFAGLKLQYYVFALTLEGTYALAGESVDDRAGTDLDCADADVPTTRCDAEDSSGTQQTYTVSFGFDF